MEPLIQKPQKILSDLSSTFTPDDLKKAGYIIRNNFYGIPIKEFNDYSTNEQRLEKCQALQDLCEFTKSFSEGNQQ